MTEEKAIKLPFWETIFRSFMHPFLNFSLFIKLSAVWMVFLAYEIFMGFPSLCSLYSDNCGETWSERISVILTALASLSITVSYCRAVILKENFNNFHFSFGKRELLFLGYNILFAFVLFIPMLLVLLAIVFIGKILGFPPAISIILIAGALLIITTYLIGLSLVFPAISVDNKEIRFKEAWEITKGNGSRILWSQVVLFIPYVLFIFIIGILFRMIGVESLVIKIIYAAVLMALTYFGACLRASYYAHIYQYFIFYKKK